MANLASACMVQFLEQAGVQTLGSMLARISGFTATLDATSNRLTSIQSQITEKQAFVNSLNQKLNCLATSTASISAYLSGNPCPELSVTLDFMKNERARLQKQVDKLNSELNRLTNMLGYVSSLSSSISAFVSDSQDLSNLLNAMVTLDVNC